jgi:hypothetical protein
LRTEFALAEELHAKEAKKSTKHSDLIAKDKESRWQLAKDNIPAIVKIQAAWKGYCERKQLATISKFRSP